MAAKVTILKHAVVDHHLAYVRDRNTRPEDFRRRIRVLGSLLIAEATREMTQVSVRVTTPMETTDCQVLAGRIVAVPVLRAGLCLVDPLLDFIPEAEVQHLGIYRDEATAQPVHYYNRLPSADPPDTGLVLDPMLATGGSAVGAVRLLEEWGVVDIRMLAVIAAPEGLERLRRDCPDVQIFCCACDRELNDRKFIVPGLGDAGDRVFGT
ncbi:MAG: uracil phosphoribosyltransferase [Fuerstiella sp.]|nr:uracil phosphoribosyltransferase [Fuerstiella sp.]